MSCGFRDFVHASICNGASRKCTDDDAYFLKTIGLAESTDEIYCDIHERTASRIHAVALQWWACLVHVPADQAYWASFDVFLDKLFQVVDLAVLELIHVNCFVNAQMATIVVVDILDV